MPRRRPTPRTVRPSAPRLDAQRVESGPDGYDYHVRSIAGSRATKTYRCPGCDQEVRPGVAHVVVWRAEAGESAVEDRRHWHGPCWTHRMNRGPTRKWS
ncbi:hypothetical protein [Mycolicibacterium grossiae]|uniref:ATP/GTP-binding protein n=1 Tax=Mycolicibacterium grossiae TaxID=1552759 RepID=A0A1E8QAI1_9MYCO|nr:hypothetical protein [Mycolicibacterium grossiae]OFJ55014.1 hypothetical protein BEL07_04470 [Mycolicibacterium grossiae]QEM47587.1 hypothetical protein FZ046_25005 [Mycolicibacterium grossiae]